MSATAERRKNRAAIRRAVTSAQKDAERRALARIRERIKAARAWRRRAMADAVRICRARRRELAGYRKRRRSEVLAELRAEFGRLACAARKSCRARKARVRRAGVAVEERARRELQEERGLYRHLRELEARHAREKKKRVRAAERRAESDDEVRGNLPPELVPVFDRVRRTIRATAGRSRTETFLEWAEQNPDVVVTMQSDAADADVVRLMAEERRRSKPQSPKRRLADELGDLARTAPALRGKERALTDAMWAGRDHAALGDVRRALERAGTRSYPATRAALDVYSELEAIGF